MKVVRFSGSAFHGRHFYTNGDCITVSDEEAAALAKRGHQVQAGAPAVAGDKQSGGPTQDARPSGLAVRKPFGPGRTKSGAPVAED